MPAEPDLAPLLRELEQGSLALTPNYRSSAQLLERYGKFRALRGRPPVCESPAIHPIDIWLRDQWQALMASGSAPEAPQILLEPALESLIWRRIIRQSHLGDALINPTATAKSAQAAYQLIQLWEIDWAELREAAAFQGLQGDRSSQPLDDLSVFLEWAGQFRDFCRQQSCLSQAQLVRKVTKALAEGRMEAPARIVLLGFENPPPRYKKLLDALVEAAASSARCSYPKTAPVLKKCVLEDASAELHQAAHWAQEILETTPEAKIGIICPDLHGAARLANRIFSRTFHPLTATQLRPQAGDVFSAPSADLLSQTPLLASALGILQLEPKPDSLQLCRVLRSPFIHGADKEEHARGRLEHRLRQREEMQIRLSDARYFAALPERDYHCPLLAKALAKLERQWRSKAKWQQTCSKWGLSFERRLRAMGWPGDRSPSPQEQRQLQQWQQTLEDFHNFSHCLGKVSHSEALSLLHELLAKPWRAAAEQASIQITGPQEADGLFFSHIWIMGLSEGQWPPSPAISPFIPLNLQKRHGITGADPQTQAAQGREILQGLVQHAASEVVFSHPRHDDDLTLRPSPMLDSFDAETMTPSLQAHETGAHPLAFPLTGTVTLEVFQDEAQVPLQPEEAISGGVSLLADQADCPFRSFARHRLKAEALPERQLGLSPRATGTLLHQVLETFWENLKDHEQLLSQTEAQLDALLADSIRQALEKTARQHPATMTRQYCSLEQSRLHVLLKQWLEQERQRGPFAIIASERQVQWRHAGLNLNMRIDRIEEVAGGNLVLVDYKSSRSTQVQWFGDERPANPQLMLYLLAAEREFPDRKVAGLFFAQLHAEECRFKGICIDGPGDAAGRDDIHPASQLHKQRGVPQSLAWEDLKTYWQETLAALASELLEGRATVSPKDQNSCRYCHLDGLCRVNEKFPQPEAPP